MSIPLTLSIFDSCGTLFLKFALFDDSLLFRGGRVWIEFLLLVCSRVRFLCCDWSDFDADDDRRMCCVKLPFGRLDSNRPYVWLITNSLRPLFFHFRMVLPLRVREWSGVGLDSPLTEYSCLWCIAHSHRNGSIDLTNRSHYIVHGLDYALVVVVVLDDRSGDLLFFCIRNTWNLRGPIRHLEIPIRLWHISFRNRWGIYLRRPRI